MIKRVNLIYINSEKLGIVYIIRIYMLNTFKE